ncbi:UDP-N-acetylmuramate--L-alanine ligase [Eisenibacter elegans]|jgi:UDP-N-acetylmuramate: L-alanyl-gamma-D-glutamyl-meso-diaminopimelate ligase|uniref:UDP-N-acetylmuramate--L-alanine ligase n=1 Tax=Eisenibacter elegans TaxID=997 RepID=UPI00040169B7|nr:Mur ligase family protein [Eisenibacter elegans]
MQKVHLIAIGGSVMHNLAIDLHLKGVKVSGSDDQIFNPSRQRLEKYGLLPTAEGWFEDKITPDLDAVILGMHARADNPELKRAQQLGLRIYSFPEYIYQQAEDKQRVVIAGSHGKTTITSIILHTLQHINRDFDYLIGAEVEGFERMVKTSHTAPVMIIEGDEYFTSVLDPTPKFWHYKHHIGVISGIAWDHINVYPSLEEYVAAFEQFAEQSPKAGTLIYSSDDPIAQVIGNKERADVNRIDYVAHPHKIKDEQTFLIGPDKQEIPLQVFGEHNMKNIQAAKLVCLRLGVTEEQFYEAIQSFRGAANRLEKVAESEQTIIFKDFAHAPSKLRATAQAVKQQYPQHHLVGCLELHTFSSLNKEFLQQYYNTFKAADTALIYYSPETVAHKKLEEISPEDIQKAFNHKNLQIFTDIEALKATLLGQDWNDKVLLMMSSGSFDQLNLEALANQIITSV